MAGAVEREAVADVEAVRAGVVSGDPEIHGLVGADRGVEQPLADAGAVPGVEEVDEVQLAEARGILVASWSASAASASARAAAEARRRPPKRSISQLAIGPKVYSC